MKTVQLRDAKAKLSALVDAAERGEATIITRHGKPAALLSPVETAADYQARRRPTFAELLMSIPDEIPFERDRSPTRRVRL